MSDTTTLRPSKRYEDVEVGDELPTLEVPLTRTLIVSTAIASRDFQDVHHDPGIAQQRGSKDIFMNILTTNGFVGRYITDWAGPNALLKAVKIRLGAPNYPGDTMRLMGQVTRKEGGLIEVAVRGTNSLGDHVVGTVVLAIPEAPIRWKAAGPAELATRAEQDTEETPDRPKKADTPKKSKKRKAKQLKVKAGRGRHGE